MAIAYRGRESHVSRCGCRAGRRSLPPPRKEGMTESARIADHLRGIGRVTSETAAKTCWGNCMACSCMDSVDEPWIGGNHSRGEPQFAGRDLPLQTKCIVLMSPDSSHQHVRARGRYTRGLGMARSARQILVEAKLSEVRVKLRVVKGEAEWGSDCIQPFKAAAASGGTLRKSR
jgi:hypothetical protein